MSFFSEYSVSTLSPIGPFHLEEEANTRQLPSGTMSGYECLMKSCDKGLQLCMCVGTYRVMGKRAANLFPLFSIFFKTIVSLYGLSISFKLSECREDLFLQAY